MDKQLQENTIATLEVLREAPFGYFLDGQTGNSSDDVLLHKEQQTEPISVGDFVKVFLYRDPKKRLTASMRLPKMKIGQIAYAKVINRRAFGCFVDVGTERGIFLPHAEMRGNPQIDESIWVRLYEDKSGRLAVSMNVDEAIQKASLPAKDKAVGDTVEGAIYNLTDAGAFLLTPERYIVFIHRSEMKEVPNVGAYVKARVTYVRDDGRLNASFLRVKEKASLENMEIILAYLDSRQGRMPYGDHSDPDRIKECFNMSKSAFKRALGGLMKKGIIKQEDGWTYKLKNNTQYKENSEKGLTT